MQNLLVLAVVATVACADYQSLDQSLDDSIADRFKPESRYPLPWKPSFDASNILNLTVDFGFGSGKFHVCFALSFYR